MKAHCKNCVHYHSAGRRHPKPEQVKFNNWCCKSGTPVNIGWCKTHNAKLEIKEPNQEKEGL